MVLSLSRLVVSFALDLININLLLLNVHPLVLSQHVAIHLFGDFVTSDVVNLIGVPGNARIHSLELDKIQIDRRILSRVRLLSLEFVAHYDVVGRKNTWIQKLLTVLDQTQQKIEPHLFGELVDALPLVVNEVFEAVDGKNRRLVWHEVEVGQKLNETLIVFDVFKFYLPERLNGDFAVDSKNHFGLDHLFLGCDEAGVGRGVRHLNFTSCPLDN